MGSSQHSMRAVRPGEIATSFRSGAPAPHTAKLTAITSLPTTLPIGEFEALRTGTIERNEAQGWTFVREQSEDNGAALGLVFEKVVQLPGPVVGAEGI